MFCRNCGAELSDNAFICLKCGVKTEGTIYVKKETVVEPEPEVIYTEEELKAKEAREAEKMKTNYWFGFILGFFGNLLGFIIGILLEAEVPGMRRGTVHGFIISTIIEVLGVIVVLVYYFAVIAKYTAPLYS